MEEEEVGKKERKEEGGGEREDVQGRKRSWVRRGEVGLVGRRRKQHHCNSQPSTQLRHSLCAVNSQTAPTAPICMVR